MKKAKLLIIILFLALILFVCSCGQEDLYIDDENDETPLQVYLMYWNFDVKSAIDKYNKEIDDGVSHNRKVEITTFEYEEFENMYDRISSEMMAGKGPDIIFFDGTTDIYMDFDKLTEQDAFADMDILIANSDTFAFDDYNMPALDTGVINGKRVMMPLSYKVNFMITTQENLDTLGLPVPGYFTYNELFEIAEKCHHDTLSISSLYQSSQIFYNIITENGLDPKGMEILKKYMELEMVDNERHDSLGDISGMAEEFYQHICNGEIIMDYSGVSVGGSEFMLVRSLYNIVVNLYDKEFIMLNEPIIDGKTTYGYVNEGCAINMNSLHKNDAFQFIEFLLSEKYQYSITLKGAAIPVGISSYEKAKSDFLNDKSGIYDSLDNYEYAVTDLPDELKEYYISLIEGVTEYKYIGQERYIVRNVIKDSITDYKNGRIDFDTMVEQINRKIKLYYSE